MQREQKLAINQIIEANLRKKIIIYNVEVIKQNRDIFKCKKMGK